MAVETRAVAKYLRLTDVTYPDENRVVEYGYGETRQNDDDINQVIEVSAQTPLLQTENSALGQVVEARDPWFDWTSRQVVENEPKVTGNSSAGGGVT